MPIVSLAPCYADDNASSDDSSSDGVLTARSLEYLGLWRTATSPKPRPPSQPLVAVPPIAAFPAKHKAVPSSGGGALGSLLQWKHKAHSTSPPRKAKPKPQPRLRPSTKKASGGLRASAQPAAQTASAFSEQFVNLFQTFGAAPQDEARCAPAGDVPVSAPPGPQHAQQGSVAAATQFGCFAAPVPQGPGRGGHVAPDSCQQQPSIAGGAIGPVNPEEKDKKWRSCNVRDLCDEDEEIRLNSSAQGEFVDVPRGCMGQATQTNKDHASGNIGVLPSWASAWRKV